MAAAAAAALKCVSVSGSGSGSPARARRHLLGAEGAQVELTPLAVGAGAGAPYVGLPPPRALVLLKSGDYGMGEGETR